MKRLIIIGNGFDVAHKLPTRYCDFVTHYWGKFNSTKSKYDFIEFKDHISYNDRLEGCKNFHDLLEKLGAVPITAGTYRTRFGSTFKFTNDFFFEVAKSHSEYEWVDIEMMYYKHVELIFKKSFPYNRDNKDTQEYFIKKLNREIDEIAKCFESYLIKEVKPLILESRLSLMESIFSNPMMTEQSLKEFDEEFSAKYFNKRYPSGSHHLYLNRKKFENTLLLNFNYTNTVDLYKDRNDITINIHGELGSTTNTILLGFGNEGDKLYSDIENLNSNEFLRFMKSSHYTKNSNYKKLFDFIEEGHFQAHIVGHSCGLSDKTLLNAIFENSNCLSVKPYYYRYEAVNEYGELDNYSDIVKNISRHFNDKKLMRDKIVNYELCSAIPQNKTKVGSTSN